MRPYSIGVSERDFLGEDDENADQGGGSVIFQQCNAQNFNGHLEGAGRVERERRGRV